MQLHKSQFAPKDSTGINIMQVANIHAMSQRCMTKPEIISTCNSLPFLALT
ncbi:hypothetical protein EC2749250_2115 [Escherichia coli 2749250]|nr:hypothetical protein EC2749250_2115 [Escherichia coli 2749250]